MSKVKIKIQATTARYVLSCMVAIKQIMRSQNELQYILMEDHIDSIVGNLTKCTFQETISLKLSSGKAMVLLNILHVHQKHYAQEDHLYENMMLQGHIDRIHKHIIELNIQNYAVLV